MTPADRDEILARMRIYALRRAATMLPTDVVEDAAQAALLELVDRRALERLEPGRDPWPFLVRLVRQELAMFARAYYGRRDLERTGTDDAGPEPEAPPFVRPGAAKPPTFSPRTTRALATLSRPQYLAVVEGVAEGRPNTITAELLGVSEAAVRQAQRRALDALRFILEEDDAA